jgi:flagellar basal-body rod modification protein FlgD
MPVAGVTDGFGPILGAPVQDRADISKLDFMNLLVAQIRNQDPLSPMDNNEFTAQLTQFSMLEQLEELKSKIEESVVIGQSINNTALLSLVGRKVTVAGDQLWVDGDEVSESTINAAGSGTAHIEVVDESGEVVAAYTREVSAGLNDVTWDGVRTDGQAATNGQYSLKVTLEDEGQPIDFVT